MKTRDGVTLRADIYRPAGDGKFPGRCSAHALRQEQRPLNSAVAPPRAATSCRRRMCAAATPLTASGTPSSTRSTTATTPSNGPPRLPHSNGKVGMFGGSYVGATQMLAAIGHPPHLAGICPIVTARNYHENWTYQGGAFEQWFNESWTSGLAQDTLNGAIVETPTPSPAATVLPLTEFPALQHLCACRRRSPHAGPRALLSRLARTPDYDAYWKQWSIEEHFPNIQVPALTIAAWYDIFQGGTLRNYIGIRRPRRQRRGPRWPTPSRQHRRTRRRRQTNRHRRLRPRSRRSSTRTKPRSTGTTGCSRASERLRPATP